MAKWEQQQSLRKVLESLYSIGQNISHMAIQGELGNVVFISRGERGNRYLRIKHIVILTTVRNYFKLSLLSSSPPKSPFILPFFSCISSSPLNFLPALAYIFFVPLLFLALFPVVSFLYVINIHIIFFHFSTILQLLKFTFCLKCHFLQVCKSKTSYSKPKCKLFKKGPQKLLSLELLFYTCISGWLILDFLMYIPILTGMWVQGDKICILYNFVSSSGKWYFAHLKYLFDWKIFFKSRIVIINVWKFYNI